MEENLIPHWPLWHLSLHNDFVRGRRQRLMTLCKEAQAARSVGEEDLC